MSARDTSGGAPQHSHSHNNTLSHNEKFWVDQVTVPQPPLGNDKGWGTTKGGGYGSRVRLDTQIVALHVHCAKGAPIKAFSRTPKGYAQAGRTERGVFSVQSPPRSLRPCECHGVVSPPHPLWAKNPSPLTAALSQQNALGKKKKGKFGKGNFQKGGNQWSTNS